MHLAHSTRCARVPCSRRCLTIRHIRAALAHTGNSLSLGFRSGCVRVCGGRGSECKLGLRRQGVTLWNKRERAHPREDADEPVSSFKNRQRIGTTPLAGAGLERAVRLNWGSWVWTGSPRSSGEPSPNATPVSQSARRRKRRMSSLWKTRKALPLSQTLDLDASVANPTP